MRQEFLTSFKSRVERLIQTSHIAAAKATEPGRVTAGKAIRTEAVPATAYSFNEPLQRVFRRLTPGDKPIASRALITQESVKIARRVVEETRRIERYGQTLMVTRQDAVERKILASAKGTETKLLSELAELKKTVPNIVHGRSPMTAAAAGFTIDQLTEQVMRRIDDQIVAHKERMGKMF